jgi:hypothetical protein
MERIVDVPYHPEKRDHQLRLKRLGVLAVHQVLMRGSGPRKGEIQGRAAAKALLEQGGELTVQTEPRSVQQGVAEHRDVDLAWPGLRIGETGVVGLKRVSIVEGVDDGALRRSQPGSELRVRSVDPCALLPLNLHDGLRIAEARVQAQQHLAGNPEQQQPGQGNAETAGPTRERRSPRQHHESLIIVGSALELQRCLAMVRRYIRVD